MRLFILLLAVLLPLPALAANWKALEISREEGLITYYIDIASIFHQSDGHYRVWTKREDSLKKMYCEAKTGNTCVKEKDPYNCKIAAAKLCPVAKNSEYEQLTVYEISCTGQIRRLNEENPSDWFYIRPETIFESFQNEVCNKNK